MEHKQASVEKFEKFTWKLENFSHIKTCVISEPFVLDGYPWKILLCQWDDVEGHITIFLNVVKTANMSKGWKRYVKFRFIVYNQVDNNKTIISNAVEQVFSESLTEWAIEPLVSSAKLQQPHSGFLVKDACIIGVEVSCYNSKHEKQVNQATSLITCLICEGKTRNLEVEITRPELEGQGQNLGELMDFKGLAQIEKTFVPLLNEVCSRHFSLIECQQKRSPKFRGWAFTALGRVLFFLKNRKVKDMNDLACKDLQILWEELQLFSFDLSWLEPHVQSALGMKNYLEKVEEVEKLNNNVVALELELERLKAKMVTADINLDVAKKLLKVEKFEQINLDVELGFVKP